MITEEKTPRKVSDGIPLITAKIIKNGLINTPTEFLPLEDYENWMVRGIPKEGDLLFVDIVILNLKKCCSLGQNKNNYCSYINKIRR